MDVLKAAFGEGRLTKEEFDSRSARVLAARTYADLAALVADLPAGPAGRRDALPRRLLPAGGPRSRRPTGSRSGRWSAGSSRSSRSGSPPSPRSSSGTSRATRSSRPASAATAWPSPGSSSATWESRAGCSSSSSSPPTANSPGASRPRFPVTWGGCRSAWWTGRRRTPPAAPPRGRSSSSASCLPSASPAASACG